MPIKNTVDKASVRISPPKVSNDLSQISLHNTLRHNLFLQRVEYVKGLHRLDALSFANTYYGAELTTWYRKSEPIALLGDYGQPTANKLESQSQEVTSIILVVALIVGVLVGLKCVHIAVKKSKLRH